MAEFNFDLQPGRHLFNRNHVKNAEPMVSIVTPYYNAGRYFEQTYNSVLNQTFPFFEWIIVNDGSEKDIEILVLLGGKDPRIRILNKENGGIASARNMAIKNSKTDIIINLDADDLIEPTYVEELYWGLYFNPAASCCYTNSVGFHEMEYVWNRKFNVGALKEKNFLCYSAAFRKEALYEVGLYDESAKYNFEDWRLWLKLFSAGKTPVKLGSYGFWYRRHASGTLANLANSPRECSAEISKVKKAAATADENIQAIEYPRGGQKNKYENPNPSNWERPFAKKKDKLQMLMLLPFMAMGGADKFNLDVVKGLNKNNFEIGIITTLASHNNWQQLFRKHAADIFNLPDFLDMENWAEFISYYIKSRQADIIFLSHSSYGYYLLPWLKKEFPKIKVVDYLHIVEWDYRGGGYARLSAKMREIIDKTLASNAFLYGELINTLGHDRKKTEILYTGGGHEEFEPDNVEKGFIHKMFCFAKQRPVVLFPCRLVPQKRPLLMLEIANGLRDYIKDVAFVVVGDGHLLDELKKHVRQKKLKETVYFAGSHTDMAPFYNDSHVTLICSQNEGLALTTYESLSMRVPVVSADVGGQAELVNETVGKIVAGHSAEAYISALKEILTKNCADKQKLKANCRSRISSGFTVNQMLDNLQNILETLMGAKKASDNTIPLGLAEELITLYGEIQKRDEASLHTSNAVIEGQVYYRDELLRIANSKLGRKLIRVMLKFRLNKLFT